MKSKLCLLTLAGLSTSLCFGAGRTTMHNSPKQSQQQLRSPSAPRRQSFLNLFAQQTPSRQRRHSNDDSSAATPSNHIKETIKELTSAILDLRKAISTYQEKSSYDQVTLIGFKKQLEALRLQLTNVDISQVLEVKSGAKAALLSFLQQSLHTVAEMEQHNDSLRTEALPRRIDTPKPTPIVAPAISDEFKGIRTNQTELTPPAPATPACAPGSDYQQKRLSELLQTPQAAQQENLKQEVASQPSVVETQLTESARQTDVSLADAGKQTEFEAEVPVTLVKSNLQPAGSLFPVFMKKHWKFLTVCGLLLTGGLLVGQTKYKLISRLFTKAPVKPTRVSWLRYLTGFSLR